MAVKSKEALKTQSAETFYDNDLGGITPADHRQFNEDLIDSMATAAQGNLAETAIQGMQLGQNTHLPIIKVSGRNVLLWPTPPATAAQGLLAATAVQSATIGGEEVTKSGTTLQLPAYPTVPQMDGFTAATISISVRESTVYYAVMGDMLVVVGSLVSNLNATATSITLTLSKFNRTLMGSSFNGAVLVPSTGSTMTLYGTTITSTSVSGSFGLQITWSAPLNFYGKTLTLMPIMIPLAALPKL